jgi:hypothetical protein
MYELVLIIEPSLRSPSRFADNDEMPGLKVGRRKLSSG